jgi:hypothetical protein
VVEELLYLRMNRKQRERERERAQGEGTGDWYNLQRYAP